MKNAMIGGLTALFATGYTLAHSASAQPLTPLANHQSGAVTLIGWGDNGQGGGYGGTPQNQSGGSQGGGYGGGQPQNQGGGYGGSNNSGNQGGTYNNNSGSQGGTYQGQGSQGGYGGNNNNGGNNGNNGGGNNGSSGTSGNTSGGNKAKQAVCLGRCHKDCQLDAIANHKPGDPFIIPKVCLDGCKQRCL
jgi:hypothetical protein